MLNNGPSGTIFITSLVWRGHPHTHALTYADQFCFLIFADIDSCINNESWQMLSSIIKSKEQWEYDLTLLPPNYNVCDIITMDNNYWNDWLYCYERTSLHVNNYQRKNVYIIGEDCVTATLSCFVANILKEDNSFNNTVQHQTKCMGKKSN